MEHFEKSIIPVIESVYPSFTPLERTVADFFIHNTDESDLSARHVSELLYVSEASLSRFAKKCGYTGYREFVYRYQEGLNATLPGTDDHIKQVLNTSHFEASGVCLRSWKLRTFRPGNEAAFYACRRGY